MEQYGSVERGWLWWPAGRVGVTSYSLTGLEQMVLVCFFISKMGDNLCLAGCWVTYVYPELVLVWGGSVGDNYPLIFTQKTMSTCRANMSLSSHIEYSV